MSLIIGTYRVNNDKVAERIEMGHKYGIKMFDTSELYGNEASVVKACHPDDYITTKMYHGINVSQIRKRCQKSKNRFNLGDVSHKINAMLLHRPLPLECWRALVEELPECDLGVSNYDYHSLVNLLNYCDQLGISKPTIHQMEVHPFVDCTGLIEYCQSQNIKVQGHTILAQGKFLNFPPLVELSQKYSVASATILVAWALSKGIDVCVSTSKEEHLVELLNGQQLTLDQEDILSMNSWYTQNGIRFYHKMLSVPLTLTSIDNPEEYINKVVAQLKIDMYSDSISQIVELLPITDQPYRTIGKQIAIKLFPDINPDAALSHYRSLIKLLRKRRVEQAQTAIMRKKGMSCKVPQRITGPYSDSIINPTPMPVDITSPSEFEPYFNYVSTALVPPAADTVFIKGAIFPDGRLDVCKQVVGPTSFERLCQTVEQSKIVKHFLLGNNIAFQDNQEAGALALAKIMQNNDKPIETWYLAGNCINSKVIEILANALIHNTQAKALWLKRNPIRPEGCIYLNKMLRNNLTLKILDLHNCAIMDEGLVNLFSCPEEIRGLKHVYLDANALEILDPVCQWVRTAPLKSLSLSINRLGDTEIIKLANCLMNHPTLKRLCLGSTHLDNDGVKVVVDMALSCPKLKCLNIGVYKSAGDMGEMPSNFYNDDSIPDLTRLLLESKSLSYLSVVGSKISYDGMARLPRLDHISMDTGKGPIHHVHPDKIIHRFKQCKRVKDIDSIYRNRM